MIYEFECSRGHVTEASVPMGTKTWPCQACSAIALISGALNRGQLNRAPTLAHRILSPTRTTFRFADTRR